MHRRKRIVRAEKGWIEDEMDPEGSYGATDEIDYKTLAAEMENSCPVTKI